MTIRKALSGSDLPSLPSSYNSVSDEIEKPASVSWFDFSNVYGEVLEEHINTHIPADVLSTKIGEALAAVRSSLFTKIKKGEYLQAVDDLSKFVETSLDPHVEEAGGRYNDGSWMKAITKLAQSYLLRRARSPTFVADAMTKVNEVVTEFPRWKSALFEQAMVLLDDGKPGYARGPLETILKLDRNHLDLGLFLLICHTQDKREWEAKVGSFFGFVVLVVLRRTLMWEGDR